MSWDAKCTLVFAVRFSPLNKLIFDYLIKSQFKYTVCDYLLNGQFKFFIFDYLINSQILSHHFCLFNK